jgi:hypothetical protein
MFIARLYLLSDNEYNTWLGNSIAALFAETLKVSIVSVRAYFRETYEKL